MRLAAGPSKVRNDSASGLGPLVLRTDRACKLAADINGDGKTDMLELFPYAGAFYRRAWLSSGYSFTQSCVTGTDELGRSKTDRVDAADKRVSHSETLGGATKTSTFTYDARHNLSQSTDPNGNITKYTSDSLGRVTQMIDPDLGNLDLSVRREGPYDLPDGRKGPANDLHLRRTRTRDRQNHQRGYFIGSYGYLGL